MADRKTGKGLAQWPTFRVHSRLTQEKADGPTERNQWLDVVSRRMFIHTWQSWSQGMGWTLEGGCDSTGRRNREDDALASAWSSYQHPDQEGSSTTVQLVVAPHQPRTSKATSDHDFRRLRSKMGRCGTPHVSSVDRQFLQGHSAKTLGTEIHKLPAL